MKLIIPGLIVEKDQNFGKKKNNFGFVVNFGFLIKKFQEYF